jgi:uncharacterized protein (TIGR03067 family)
MGVLLAVAVFTVGAAGRTAADDEATTMAMKALEGKYTPKGLFKGGKAAPPEMIAEVEYMVIKDSKIIIKKKNGKEEPAKFTIDVSHKPPHIDLMPTKGPKQDMKLKGIYRPEKGTLTIVLSREGYRPKDFKAEGEHEMKMVFERKTDD